MRYIIGKCTIKWSVRKQCEVNDVSWLANNASYAAWTFNRNYARNTNYCTGFSFSEAIEIINLWKRHDPDALYWIEEQ